jgi:drug/metabolite transporter (DMT)-like permease
MTRSAVSPRALLLLLILTLVWGTNWPLFPIAMREISVWTFRAITLGAGGVLLLAIARARGLSLQIPREHWATVGLSAMVYIVVWNIASGYSAITIPSGQTAVLGFSMPLWVALISWALLGEHLNRQLMLAILFGGSAVALLMVPGLASYANAPLGFAAGLTAGLGWAIGTLLIKRRCIKVTATVLTGWQLVFAAVPITLCALLLGDRVWFMPSWQSIAVITYITLVPMCIGNVCWFALIEILPANIAGLSSVLIPVVAMISGALVHDEPLGLLQWLAMAACMTALWLALPSPVKRS